MPEPIEFRSVPADVSPARELIQAMIAEINGMYGGDLEDPRAPSATPAELSPVRGGDCLVGEIDGEPVCVGALKDLGGGAAEIKRMYVAPAGRSRGVARRLLEALEDRARELGYDIARLDTGPQQPHAKALYLSAGYREIPDYNDNPFAAFWAEKPL